MIDHQVVMVNAMNTRGNSSVIKFGGYDESALQAGSSLVVLRTKSEKSFTLIAAEFYYGAVNLLSGVAKDIELNPHLPYLYVPDADITHIMYQINAMYPDGSAYPIDCDYSNNYCRWSASCDTITAAGLEKSLRISLAGSDSGTFAFVSRPGSLFVDGKNFGEAPGSYCYLPIFRSMLTDAALSNTWFLGSLFMMEYVVVYDNTPFHEHGETYCQVGFGTADPYNVEKNLEAIYGGAPISPLDTSHKLGAWDPKPKPPDPGPPGPTPPAPPGPTPGPTPVPPSAFNQWVAQHLAVFIIVTILVLVALLLIIYRIFFYKPPKTYYNGVYSLAEDAPTRINDD